MSTQDANPFNPHTVPSEMAQACSIGCERRQRLACVAVQHVDARLAPPHNHRAVCGQRRRRLDQLRQGKWQALRRTNGERMV